MERFDLVVVGAGPSGSVAARTAAALGIRTLLLEKEREIGRSVVCAEGISRRALLPFAEPQPRWIASTVDRVKFFSPSGDFFEIVYPEVGYILERKLFDRYLAEQAALVGAEIRTAAEYLGAERANGKLRVRYRHLGKEETVETPLLIGADGPASRVGKSLGMKVDIPPDDLHLVAQFLMVHPDFRAGEMHIYVGHECCPKGYGWLFPKGDGRANVGLGIHPGYGNQLRYLERFVRARFPEAQIVYIQQSVVPVGGHKLQIVADHVMLVGDAARLADPFSGGGISPGMISGKMAAEVAAEALEAGDFSQRFLSRYPQRFFDRYGQEYRLSYGLREFFMSLSDEDLEFLVQEFKKIFHDRRLDTLDMLPLARDILKSSPRLFGFLLRKGKDAFKDYLRNAVFSPA